MARRTTPPQASQSVRVIDRTPLRTSACSGAASSSNSPKVGPHGLPDIGFSSHFLGRWKLASSSVDSALGRRGGCRLDLDLGKALIVQGLLDFLGVELALVLEVEPQFPGLEIHLDRLLLY